MRVQRNRDPLLHSQKWFDLAGLAPLTSQCRVGNRRTRTSVTSMEFDSFESNLASDPAAQHEAVHQVIYVRGRHLSGSAEERTIEQPRKEPSLPLSDTNRNWSRGRVPRQPSQKPCRKVQHPTLLCNARFLEGRASKGISDEFVLVHGSEKYHTTAKGTNYQHDPWYHNKNAHIHTLYNHFNTVTCSADM